MVELRDLKRDFERGLVISPVLRNEPILGGYTLNFQYQDGKVEMLSNRRDKDYPRIFKTSDAALNVLRDLGVFEARLLFA
jgi:hypothetical protein